MKTPTSSVLSLLFLACILACNAEPAGVRDITADELISLSKAPSEFVLLDVRSPAEFASGHIAHALNIPHAELPERLPELEASKSAPVIVYCEKGIRASMATDVLLEAGYSDVMHLTGDMRGWRSEERPLVQEVREVREVREIAPQ